MSDTEQSPEPGLPLLWQALVAVKLLGIKMCETLYFIQGTTIEGLYALSQRPKEDWQRVLEIMRILQRQVDGIADPDRSLLEDAMVRLDKIKDMEGRR